MNKLKISMGFDSFKAIMKACKPFISKDNARPILQTIKLNCSDGYCIASACDGFKLINFKVPCSADNGVLCIPIIKTPTKGTQVIITDNEKEITFDFITEKQVVRKIEGEAFKTEGFITNDEPTIRIGFNPKLLKDALDGFTDEKIVKIDVIDERKGFILRGTNKEALVLPVYLRK